MGTVIELVKLNDQAIYEIQSNPPFWRWFAGTFYPDSTRKPYLYAPKEPFYLYLDKWWQQLHYVLCPQDEAQGLAISYEPSDDPLSWSLSGKNHLSCLDDLTEYPTKYNSPIEIEQILNAFKTVNPALWEGYCLESPNKDAHWIAERALYSLDYLNRLLQEIAEFYEQALHEKVNVLIRSY